MTNAISNSITADYDLDRLHQLGQQGASASDVMTTVATHAKLQSVAIRGDDKSYDELVKAFKEADALDKTELALHTADVVPGLMGSDAVDAAAHALLPAHLAHVAPVAVEIAAPIAALVIGAYKLNEANAHGEELNQAIARDAEHVAMLCHLDLPSQFRDHEVAKYTATGKDFQGAVLTMATPMASQDRILVKALQVQCDRGMLAAFDVPAGTTKEAYLAAHPDVAERYASDAAFKTGFDVVQWAATSKNNTDALRNDLNDRVDLYNASHIAVRG